MSTSSSKESRVFLWCVPRSVSTAVLKCISNVPGVVAWHEPYVSAYINTTLHNPLFMAENPKMTKIRQRMTNPPPEFMEKLMKLPRGNLQDQKLFTYSWLKDRLEENIEEGNRCVFVKDMSFAVSGRYGDLPASYRHTFLIRHPVQVYQSWKRVVAADFCGGSDEGSVDVTTDIPLFNSEAFYKDSFELWKYATEIGEDSKPVIVDADDLRNHPDVILPKYFEEIGLEFDDRYLQWDAGQDIIQTWRGSFQQTVGGGMVSTAYAPGFRSSCFKKPAFDKPDIDVTSLSPDLQKCIAESMPFYEAMYEARITAD